MIPFVDRVNYIMPSFRLRKLDIRNRYARIAEMRKAFESLATGAYTPHQYLGEDFDETHNPNHWVLDAGSPHRVVFTFAPLPPSVG